MCLRFFSRGPLYLYRPGQPRGESDGSRGFFIQRRVANSSPPVPPPDDYNPVRFHGGNVRVAEFPRGHWLRLMKLRFKSPA